MGQLEMWQVWSLLGQHRHPDWWPKPSDWRVDSPGRGRGRVLSERATTTPEQRIANSRNLFEARRAAKRGEAAAPAWTTPDSSQALVSLARRG